MAALIYYIYALLTEILYFLASPILHVLLKQKPHYERLGRFYPNNEFDIIAHAASVGEINAIKPILIKLVSSPHELRILLTSNTIAGRNIAQSIHPNIESIISVLDILHLRLKQIRITKPKLIILAETELWPNLLFASKFYKTPVIIINARMTDKSYKKFMVIKRTLNFIGKEIHAICCQTEKDRFKYASIFNTICYYCGNLKFNVILPVYDNKVLRNKWGFNECNKIIALGSSRPGEEELLLKTYCKLKQEFRTLKLIIAPRHLDRLDKIKDIFADTSYALYSNFKNQEDVLILDEIGILSEAYSICNIAVIGGSFFPYGGHNPLEAAFYGKIIVMGPYYNSCLDSVEKLVESHAIKISSEENLFYDLRNILLDYDGYIKNGKNAKKVMDDNNQSLTLHLSVINGAIENYA